MVVGSPVYLFADVVAPGAYNDPCAGSMDSHTINLSIPVLVYLASLNGNVVCLKVALLIRGAKAAHLVN